MSEIEELRAQLERERARADGMARRSLDDQLRAAATKAGIHTHAVDDALFRGRSMFTLDENGHAVQLGDDGQPVLGKDGKTPFSPVEWLDSMKEAAPHWFPVVASGSGGGGGVRGAGIHQQDRARMSAAEKSAYISKHGRDAYMALPDSSGSRR